MAEAPKTEEYVSARFRTLQGQEQQLTFARGAALGFFVVRTETIRANRERESEKQIIAGEMQKELCLAFSKYYPFVEVSLVVDEKTVFLDMIDRPLLHAAEGKTILAIFKRQTDMRHLDKCFRGQPSYEEDLRESSAGGE